MACCYQDECGEFSVTPMLVAPCLPARYREEPAICYPCLPSCPKGKDVYCCEEKHRRHRSPVYDQRKSPPPRRQCCKNSAPSDSSQNPCSTCCKPIKMKYVIPCYRYEDGRIANQPNSLMRRACEVAVGARVRRKPFVESSYRADANDVEHRYHSEDERGNCRYYFERQKQEQTVSCPGIPRYQSEPSPFSDATCDPDYQYVDCIQARVTNNPKTCYYYC
ncbi:hypothetical protein ACJJTC_008052 [Scirpophaga incertulas]